MTTTLKRADIPALGSMLLNGRTLTALHHTWYAGEGELPNTVVVAVKRDQPHPYAVWDIVRREDGVFQTLSGSYFEWAVDAFEEYGKRIDCLAIRRKGYEVEVQP